MLAWLRLANLQFSQIRGRQPYLIVRKILYVIGRLDAARALLEPISRWFDEGAETADLRRARHALAYFITMLCDPMAAEPMKRVLFAATALLFASCSVPTRSVVPLFDHSITRSAPASSIFGITMPRAFAALRLITSSNFVGAPGRSAGFAPRRMQFSASFIARSKGERRCRRR